MSRYITGITVKVPQIPITEAQREKVIRKHSKYVIPGRIHLEGFKYTEQPITLEPGYLIKACMNLLP